MLLHGNRISTGERVKRGMRQASIDRVDSSKPYEPSNVVWCLTVINYLKNDYSAEDVADC